MDFFPCNKDGSIGPQKEYVKELLENGSKMVNRWQKPTAKMVKVNFCQIPIIFYTFIDIEKIWKI